MTTPASASGLSTADHYTFVAPAPTVTIPTMTVPTMPSVAGLAESNSIWHEGHGLATFARKKLPVGTTFSFTLNQPAHVSLVFTQKLGGRSVKGHCVTQTKRNKKQHACQRTATQGRIGFAAHAGLNRISFQGRISRSKKLNTGRFTLVITATNAAGQRSDPRSLSFTIAK